MFSRYLATVIAAAALLGAAPSQPRLADTAAHYLYGSVADPSCSNAGRRCDPDRVTTNVDPALMARITASIDDYWKQAFSTHHTTYTPPTIVWYVGTVEPVNTRCGVATAEPAFYCARDETIYLDSSLLAQAPFSDAGDIAVAVAIAHEWTHHVQNLLRLHRSLNPLKSTEFYPEYLELQADCGAGVWAWWMTSEHYLDARDVPLAIEFLGSIGDPTSTPLSVDAHGTDPQRIAAFEAGYSGGHYAADCKLPLD